MAVAAEPQTSIYETELQDDALAGALDTRQELKDELAEARRAYKEADGKAKGLIEAHELGDGAVVRVGRFLIKRTPIPARSVAFETNPSSRTTISLLEASE